MDKLLKIRGLFFAGLLVIALGCDDDTEDAPIEVKDEQPTEIRIDPGDEHIMGWNEFYSKEDLSFSLDSFDKADTIKGELFTQHFAPGDSFYQHYGRLISYNDDSSMFIDPYSGSWIVEIRDDGMPYAREGEIEQEVAVVDVAKQTRTRLLFCGPSCIIQRAYWYSDNIVCIMGLMAEYTDEYYTPTMWFVNINNGLTIPYQYHSSSVSIMHGNEYTAKYMQSKGVNMAY